jgi:exodeoxyribonuclease VII large subunit
MALWMARPADRLARERMQLAMHERHLARAMSAAWLRAQHRLQQLAARLEALDPQRVVARGYSIVETAGGELVVDPSQLEAGTRLELTLARGAAEVQLQSARRR